MARAVLYAAMVAAWLQSSRPTPMTSLRAMILVFWIAATSACSEGPARGEKELQAEIESLLDAGDLVAAERQAKSHIAIDPEDPSLRLTLGRIYLAAGDGPAAYSAFDRAQALGASATDVIPGMAESLMLQEEYADVVDLLSSTPGGSQIPASLLKLRLRARVRVPLANPAAVFLDARSLLAVDAINAVAELEALASQPGTIPANTEHILRAIAYWTCQNATDPAEPQNELYQPSWANRDETGRRVLAVGPAHELKTPGEAARVVKDGDVVDIQAGTYAGDVAVWQANDLWIRAKGGKVILDSRGATADNMGIWNILGDRTIVEGIRFQGARSTHNNGSGIRLLAHNLWVRHSEFHDNEVGLLSFNQPGGEVIVEYSVFTENGAGDGLHNVYIGRIDRLTFRFSYSTGADLGHQLKSRAVENYILYNRLSDKFSGNSSYTIDLPEGGFALIMGNEIQQGPLTVNKHMISLGAEKAEGREHRFLFSHNTFYNNTSPATFIKDATGTGVILFNNVFAGAPAAFDAATPVRIGNAFAATTDLVDPRRGDYQLKPSASFIDIGNIPPEYESVDNVSLVPRYEYVHPAGASARKQIWRPDPGAHEFCGWPEYPAS